MRYVHPSMLENPWREFDNCREDIAAAATKLTDPVESEEMIQTDDEVDN